MEQKADASDLEKLCGVIESKVDLYKMQDALEKKMQQQFQTNQSLTEMINNKVDSREIERLAQALEATQKSSDERFQAVEEEMENLLNDFKTNMDTMRLQTLDGLSKKADFAFLDKVREQLTQKTDFEYFQKHIQKVRQEIEM